MAVVAPVALIAAARELGWISVPLIQPRRQTREWWWKVYGRRVAALLWGLDLGLVFTTWFTFAGPWALAALAFTTANPGFGVAVFAAYWLGRALPIWAVPLLLKRKTTMEMLDEISREYRNLQLTHAGALLSLAALLLVPAIQ